MKISKKVLQQVFLLAAIMTGLFIVGLVQSASAKPASALGPWTQQWADEFNGSGAVSGSNWIYDIGHCYPGCPAANWGTGEIAAHTNSTANVNQTGGHLAITPIRDGAGNWTSGRIETVRTDFQPPAGGGMAIEASIQLPNVTGAAAQGYWPAFWTLGAPFRGVYTNWPGVGEIDIMENINGNNTVFGTLHCGVSPGGPCNETTGLGGSRTGVSPSLQAAYHTYRMEFDKSVSPQQLRWYLDGVQYHTVNANQVDATTWNNATNHGFFIILNVAIGGGWPGNPTGSTANGVPMNVDWVRVHYANGAGAATPTRTNTPSGPVATATRTNTPGGPTPTRTPTPASSGGNLALNKPATASSGGTGYTANLAFDGNMATRWGSDYSDPQWVRVDLGSTQTITRVVLRWEGAYGRSYQVQTSNDGNTWTNIYSTTTGDGGVDDLTVSGSGRYVRMYGTVRATQWGYSLWEFEVYGSGGGGPTATPVPAGDYTRGVTRLNSTQAQIWFTSNVNSAWVDVHYTVNGGGQQNFRMVKNGNTHTQTVSGLATGNVINYWFTYEKAGLAYDTGQFSYTH